MLFAHELHDCYFCDEPKFRHSLTKFGDNLVVCDHCGDFKVPIDLDNQRDGECCVCFEEVSLFKLWKCPHELCLKCCKTIYFGSTMNERPIDWKEMIDESLDWPYELDEDNPNYAKHKEYSDEYDDFSQVHFNSEIYSYDELIIIRNSLISARPIWMNTEEFINYENASFRYHTERAKCDNLWVDYEATKTRGNASCPLCRSYYTRYA